MNQIIEELFVGPLWPASILACLMIGYTMLAAIGLVDLDFGAPDIDLDVDVPDLGVDVPDVAVDVPDVGVDVPDVGVDADVAVDAPDGDVPHVSSDLFGGLAGLAVRWTNFGRLPIVIWGGVFTVAYWGITAWLWYAFDSNRYAPTWLPSTLLAVRNFVIATAITKVITQPMLKLIKNPIKYGKDQLLGCTCEISSIEATPTFGQAKFRTDASPLLLNVRTNGPAIAKGTEVRIIGFDKEKRIYTVTNLEVETQL